MRFRIAYLLFAMALVGGGLLSISAIAQTTGEKRQGTFTGHWAMSGDSQVLGLGEGRQVATFQIEGLLNIQGDTGLLEDFWSRCIGLSDPVTGGVARCTLRGDKGDLIFSELTSKELLEQDATRVEGRLVGGTGAYAGILGSYSFTWTSLFTSPEAQVFERGQRRIHGFARSVKGEWRLP